jgi:hypothetical protein
MQKEIRNINEFNFIKKEVKNYLESESIIDKDDGEIYASTVELTRDTLADFKNNCESYQGYECEEFEGQKIEILKKFQFKKGDVRKTLFFIENKDSQNLVILY